MRDSENFDFRHARVTSTFICFQSGRNLVRNGFPLSSFAPVRRLAVPFWSIMQYTTTAGRDPAFEPRSGRRPVGIPSPHVRRMGRCGRLEKKKEGDARACARSSPCRMGSTRGLPRIGRRRCGMVPAGKRVLRDGSSFSSPPSRQSSRRPGASGAWARFPSFPFSVKWRTLVRILMSRAERCLIFRFYMSFVIVASRSVSSAPKPYHSRQNGSQN